MRKAIIFDCDNTLWKGILGEEEVIHNTELQEDIIFLARHGVIIGLCSKNNEEDVLKELEENQILTEEYISVHRINWKDKVSNLKEIAEELNIGLDAIVFVDDSKFEIGLVTQQLPTVFCILNLDLLMRTVVYHFDLTGDISKTRQYKENLQRARVKEQFTNIDDYLRSLEMVLTIKLNDKEQIPRISELTQKTNQFNLTTRRYSEEAISAMMLKNCVFSLSVKDKYGDNGLVGVCIIIESTIDVFLLSCRVLGRDIEYAFMDYIIQNLGRMGYVSLIGNYIKSEKNQQVGEFYNNCGFKYLNSKKEIIIFILAFEKYESNTQEFYVWKTE